MHPNVFLKTLWRMELRPEIFVAMSFDPRHDTRFNNVFKPAIEGITFNNVALHPNRVDLSRTGDSILTDIMNGIAHAHMVLADVSSVGFDKDSGAPYRNGNVMYEVGLALACRQPVEVLIVRDDTHPCLFDVSTIPHVPINFNDEAGATERIRSLLLERLRERSFIDDARVTMAIDSLSGEEIEYIKIFNIHEIDRPFRFNTSVKNLPVMMVVPRLLEKKILRLAGTFESGAPAYLWTQLGFEVKNRIELGLPTYIASLVNPPSPPVPDSDADPGDQT